MTEELKKVVVELAKKAQEAKEPHQAMQLAQAALSVAQAHGTLKNSEAT